MRKLFYTLLIFKSLSALATECPTELSKSKLLGKVSNPTKFYTPIKEFCSDETLHIFSNCIENNDSEKTIYFGSRERYSVAQSQSPCPYGYAPQVKNGFLKFQKVNGKTMCLDPCDSVAVGKFFRDEDKFGMKRTLNVGDVIYIPELKGLKCGNKTHQGCVTVSQFIEYTNEPVIDVYSGTCKSISRGLCHDFSDKKLPDAITLYKVNTRKANEGSETQLSSEVQNNLLNF